MNKIKKVSIFIFLILLTGFLSDDCLGQQNPATDVSVSISSNPFNRILQRIEDTRKILKQKQQELQIEKAIDVKTLLILIVIGLLVVVGIFLIKQYFVSQKRKKRREKRKDLQKRKKRKKKH